MNAVAVVNVWNYHVAVIKFDETKVCTNLLCLFMVLKISRPVLAMIPTEAITHMAINIVCDTIRNTVCTIVRSCGGLPPETKTIYTNIQVTSKNILLVDSVQAHKLELPSKAFIQRNEMK